MAVRYIGIVGGNPTMVAGNVVGAASGGTLAGGQSIQVVFDDTVFAVGNLSDAKQRLLAALELIENRIEVAHAWPIGPTS